MKKILALALLIILAGCTTDRNNNVDLSGEWSVKLDPEDIGINERWFNKTLDERIILPGSLQEQGFGNDVDTNTLWTGQIVDNSWFTSPVYEKYRQKGNIKVPFWLNPEKHYVGAAWYQKEIIIPEHWRGKVIILELERTHWETMFFINGEIAGYQDGLSTPHRHVLPDLAPGKHIITLRVDNRVHLPVGINAHSVSDHTQSNWNGITGELTDRKSVV